MSETSLTREEILVLAKAAGLDLPPEYFDELVDAYGHLQTMIARLPRNRAHSDEPAHVFRATTFLPQEG
jgi:hypothetical protein